VSFSTSFIGGGGLLITVGIDLDGGIVLLLGAGLLGLLFASFGALGHTGGLGGRNHIGGLNVNKRELVEKEGGGGGEKGGEEDEKRGSSEGKTRNNSRRD
jgi:hypothetical protein